MFSPPVVQILNRKKHIKHFYRVLLPLTRLPCVRYQPKKKLFFPRKKVIVEPGCGDIHFTLLHGHITPCTSFISGLSTINNSYNVEMAPHNKAVSRRVWLIYYITLHYATGHMSRKKLWLSLDYQSLVICNWFQ